MADRRELSPTLETLIRLMTENNQAGMWTALPAVITFYAADKGTCECVPLIKCKRIDEKGAESWVSIPKLVDVPVVFPNGGGYSLTFPVKPDDECLVVFASRCIDAWFDLGPGDASDPAQVQSDMRMHDLSDGFALVGPRSRPNVIEPAPITDGTELRADDGSSYVRIDDLKNVTVKAENNVSVDAGGDVQVQAGADLLATAAGNANVTAAGDITLTATNLILNGNIIHTGTVLSNGVPIGSTHRHDKLGGGAGITGGPQA